MSEDIDPNGPRLFGKYRGIVDSNADPRQSGRLQVRVPAAFGNNVSLWADPCVPYADDKAGFFVVPPAGAQVWIDFEAGDPSRPIWVGCFWRPRQAPSPSPNAAVFKFGRTTLEVSTDGSGGVLSVTMGSAVDAPTLRLGENGASLTVKKASLELTATEIKLAIGGDRVTVRPGRIEAATSAGASVSLMGPKVSLNGNALEVI